jgi:hypothetical protein
MIYLRCQHTGGSVAVFQAEDIGDKIAYIGAGDDDVWHFRSAALSAILVIRWACAARRLYVLIFAPNQSGEDRLAAVSPKPN